MNLAQTQERGLISKEQFVSTEEALHEATNTTVLRRSMNPPEHINLAPQPYLPLREASAQRLRSRAASPRLLFTASSPEHSRGFRPRIDRLEPHMDAVTASSEHAFAGRDTRRPAKLPLDMQGLNAHPIAPRSTNSEWSKMIQARDSTQPPSPSLLSPRPRSKSKMLRNVQSLGEGFQGGRRVAPAPRESHLTDGPSTARSSFSRPSLQNRDTQSSFRSITTTDSTVIQSDSFVTNRSSQVTRNSSTSFVHICSDSGLSGVDGDMSVEDAIGMYEEGFESSRPSSAEAGETTADVVNEPASLSKSAVDMVFPPVPRTGHRRSKSASLVHQWKTLNPLEKSTPARRASSPPKPIRPTDIPRDRYGFKKVSHHITLDEFDAWNTRYTKHLDRRRQKWAELMSSYGLSIKEPYRFPPKSDKVKRYVRKGIPPELRGAAWYWYAGGPGVLTKNPTLYSDLLQQVQDGKLSDNDKEHIERDLNRTFPDNDRFKPDSSYYPSSPEVSQRTSTGDETRIVCALRRVLQAFAVHNPSIGYCQSLNFIAGLLLLFLQQNEEKVFALLTIITTEHLPGTHGIALEGANIDIAVLMSCIKETLPQIWAKLDDKGSGAFGETAAGPLRLPTVSLATTAWFMSLFVGTLPIESVLRVWDCLFFEGSKTLFRIALAIFKASGQQIMSINDPMEIFQVVQTIPRTMLDINSLMEICFRRRGGFAHISQGLIETKREERRLAVRNGLAIREDEPGRPWTRRWRTLTKV